MVIGLFNSSINILRTGRLVKGLAFVTESVSLICFHDLVARPPCRAPIQPARGVPGCANERLGPWVAAPGVQAWGRSLWIAAPGGASNSSGSLDHPVRDTRGQLLSQAAQSLQRPELGRTLNRHLANVTNQEPTLRHDCSWVSRTGTPSCDAA